MASSLRERMALFIEKQQEKYPDLTEKYAEIRALEERKLWHELTETLAAFAKDSKCNRGDNLIMVRERNNVRNVYL